MRPGTKLRWIALKNIFLSEIKQNSMIIDIGSYDGVISRNLQNIIPKIKVVILDKDTSGLLLAKKMGLNAIRASILNLPINRNSYDVVLCLDLIEHVEEDEMLIEELSRILKEEGKIILTTPTKNGVNFPFLPKKYSDLINIKWGHVRKGYSLETLIKIFLKYGLLIIKKGKYFNYLSRFFYWLAFLAKYALKPSNFFFHFIMKLEPYFKVGAAEHVIVAQKKIM